MNIIAFDSADHVLSVALSTENGVWYSEIDAGSRHSELILDCADNLCKISGIKPEDLEMAACMKGPGSFTGLRIGFSAVKGLALALGIPLITVPTLDCLAYHLSVWPGLVLPAIDAKKNSFFSAFYREGKRLTDYMDASVEILAKEAAGLGFSQTDKKADSPGELLVLTGSGAQMLYSQLSEYILPDFIRIDPLYGRGRARELLQIIKDDKLQSVNENDKGPFYLRKSDAELKLI